jgi:hypothetical protein
MAIFTRQGRLLTAFAQHPVLSGRTVDPLGQPLVMAPLLNEHRWQRDRLTRLT